jgi:two-component sensor histidine kinase
LRKNTHQNFNQSNGIANEYLYAILPYKKRFLWISTNKGLSCFDTHKNTFINYDNTDGLQSNEFNTGAYYSSEKGEFFFGGVNGFNSFFPNKISRNFYKPQIVLTGFKIQDEEVLPSLGNSVLLSQISLPFYQNTVSFDFAALEFTHPEKNKYKYILEGVDNNWVNSESKGFARYSGLKYGSYIFKVKGSNNDGIWSDEKILMQVIILSPWWTSWWFVLLSAVFFILFITNIVRVIFAKKIRDQQRIIEKQKAVEHERARISKDMHDDMGSGLSKIAIMSELLKTNLKEERETEQVEKISRTAKDLVDSMGQIVWAMNPENDSLENLAAYIREYTLDFFDESLIECKFIFPDEINTIKLTQQQRRNVFLVIKESLNNILKYAESTEVQVQLFIRSKKLHLIISDNGKGFDVSQTRRFGNGLINMKKRMEEIGGEYQIQSTLTNGTTTTISVLL